MNVNRIAIATTVLAVSVIASSLWITSRTQEPVEVPQESEPIIESPVSEVSAESSEENVIWFEPSADTGSSGSLFVPAESSSVPEVQPPVSSDGQAEEPSVSEDTPSLSEPSVPDSDPEPEQPTSKPDDEPVRQPLTGSDTVSFSLRLIDEDGFPVYGAQVIIGEHIGRTNREGWYKVDVEDLDYVLQIHAEGYAPYYAELELGGQTKWEMVVSLQQADQLRELLDSVELHPYRTNIPELNAYMEEITNKIFTSGMDTYDKVKACYDWVIKNTGYKRPSHTGSGYWSCALQAMKTGIGTCNCYSAEFAALMRYIGLDCYIVEGITSASGGGMTGHYWTLIDINGTQYIFDPQVEDAIADRTRDKVITYLRFCVREPNVKYVYSVRSKSRCMQNFLTFLNQNGTFLDS